VNKLYILFLIFYSLSVMAWGDQNVSFSKIQEFCEKALEEIRQNKQETPKPVQWKTEFENFCQKEKKVLESVIKHKPEKLIQKLDLYIELGFYTEALQYAKILYNSKSFGSEWMNAGYASYYLYGLYTFTDTLLQADKMLKQSKSQWEEYVTKEKKKGWEARKKLSEKKAPEKSFPELTKKIKTFEKSHDEYQSLKKKIFNDMNWNELQECTNLANELGYKAEEYALLQLGKKLAIINDSNNQKDWIEDKIQLYYSETYQTDKLL